MNYKTLFKNESCIICKYPISEIHHIIPKEFGGNDEADNLINLCPNHHTAIHIIMKISYLFADKLRSKEYVHKYGQNQSLFNDYIKIQTFDKKCFKYYQETILPQIKFSTDVEIVKLIKKSKVSKL